jgi:hypothetical protein
METSGDESRRMRNVSEEKGANVVGNRSESSKIDGSAVRARSGDDRPRPHFPRFRCDISVIEESGRLIDTIEVRGK